MVREGKYLGKRVLRKREMSNLNCRECGRFMTKWPESGTYFCGNCHKKDVKAGKINPL